MRLRHQPAGRAQTDCNTVPLNAHRLSAGAVNGANGPLTATSAVPPRARLAGRSTAVGVPRPTWLILAARAPLLVGSTTSGTTSRFQIVQAHHGSVRSPFAALYSMIVAGTCQTTSPMEIDPPFAGPVRVGAGRLSVARRRFPVITRRAATSLSRIKVGGRSQCQHVGPCF